MDRKLLSRCWQENELPHDSLSVHWCPRTETDYSGDKSSSKIWRSHGREAWFPCNNHPESSNNGLYSHTDCYLDVFLGWIDICDIQRLQGLWHASSKWASTLRWPRNGYLHTPFYYSYICFSFSVCSTVYCKETFAQGFTNMAVSYFDSHFFVYISLYLQRPDHTLVLDKSKSMRNMQHIL